MKKIILFIVFAIMLIITIHSAMAFSLDSDDVLYVSRGESVNGMFVIEGYNPSFKIEPSSSWITIMDTIRIIDDNYAVHYIVSVPERTDVNVYREQIVVSDGSETKIMNVKISVQNSFFKNLFNIFSNPIYIRFAIAFILLILIVILYFIYQGAKNV